MPDQQPVRSDATKILLIYMLGSTLVIAVTGAVILLAEKAGC